jgi:hypothetical protein
MNYNPYNRCIRRKMWIIRILSNSMVQVCVERLHLFPGFIKHGNSLPSSLSPSTYLPQANRIQSASLYETL